MGVLVLTETFTVLLPEAPVIGFVSNVASTPPGKPLTLKVTLSLKPADGVDVTV